MTLDTLITRSPRFSEILGKAKDNHKEAETIISEYMERLTQLAAKIPSGKIDEESKLYFARHIESADDYPGNFLPISIEFQDILEAMKKYSIPLSTGKKEEIPELGLRLVMGRGRNLDVWFYAESRYGDPLKRLQDILNDNNVIKVDVRYKGTF